jgi:hypothetical protein
MWQQLARMPWWKIIKLMWALKREYKQGAKR